MKVKNCHVSHEIYIPLMSKSNRGKIENLSYFLPNLAISVISLTFESKGMGTFLVRPPNKISSISENKIIHGVRTLGCGLTLRHSRNPLSAK